MFTQNAFFSRRQYWMVEDTSSGLAAVLMAFDDNGGARSSACSAPYRRWSDPLLKLMQATASSDEYTMPTSAAASSTTSSIDEGGGAGGHVAHGQRTAQSAHDHHAFKAQVDDAGVLGSSRPAPQGSGTEAKVSVYCSSSTITDRLLSRCRRLQAFAPAPFPSVPPFPRAWRWPVFMAYFMNSTKPHR